jgi:hypothetical protein
MMLEKAKNRRLVASPFLAVRTGTAIFQSASGMAQVDIIARPGLIVFDVSSIELGDLSEGSGRDNRGAFGTVKIACVTWVKGPLKQISQSAAGAGAI